MLFFLIYDDVLSLYRVCECTSAIMAWAESVGGFCPKTVHFLVCEPLPSKSLFYFYFIPAALAIIQLLVSRACGVVLFTAENLKTRGLLLDFIFWVNLREPCSTAVRALQTVPRIMQRSVEDDEFKL